MLRQNGVGKATWEGVTFAQLKGYLKARKAKTQANREMSVLQIVWNYARGAGLTELPWPAAGMERSRWKNKEAPREFEVTDALFAAVYSHAGPLLRDCMDISTATGMRITDARLCTVPSGAEPLGLRMSASKTGKRMEFDVTTSSVLTGLLERRRAIKADHLFLLTTPDGKPVTAQMLRGAWDRAREAAAKAHPELADQIRAMYLRDMRKRAASLAGTLDEASELLQHSDKRITRLHYRQAPAKVKPVR
jgi:integrase